ncbi:MAG: hypothetical protein R2822_13105 [Spirosomataceae bacterium]
MTRVTKKPSEILRLSNNPGTYNAASFDDSKTKVTFAAGDTAIFIPGVEWTKSATCS